MNVAARIQQVINEFTDRITSAIVVGVTEALHEETPKDTTFASVNWRPTIGYPFLEVQPRNRSRDDRAALVPQYRATQLSNLSGINTVRGLRDSVYIVNNAPYIGGLNGGSSSQAPAGFVQEAIHDGIRHGIAQQLDRIRRRNPTITIRL